MTSRAKSLFHFTSSLDSLKAILRSGRFWPRYSLEDYSWIGVGSPFWAFPMCCFCDIPLSRVSDHMGLYGRYGLGLTHEWAERCDITPVIYVAPDRSTASALTGIIAGSTPKGNDADTQQHSLSKACHAFISYVKPTHGLSLRSGESQQQVFYIESEWRFVPHLDYGYYHDGKFMLSEQDFTDDHFLEAANHATFPMGPDFAADDIRYLLVDRTDEIPELIAFMEAELAIPFTELRILYSKITSTELMLDL